MTPMRSMEFDDEEKMDVIAPMTLSKAPDYPYGLQICLTDAELRKLDLDPKQAFVGGIVHLHALARITSVSSREEAGRKGDKVSRVEMQIEDMSIESEDEENEETR